MLGNGALFKVKGRDSKYRRGEGSQVEHIKPCRSHGGGLAWTIDSIVMLGSSVGD
jgi:hypothetical protein